MPKVPINSGSLMTLDETQCGGSGKILRLEDWKHGDAGILLTGFQWDQHRSPKSGSRSINWRDSIGIATKPTRLQESKHRVYQTNTFGCLDKQRKLPSNIQNRIYLYIHQYYATTEITADIIDINSWFRLVSAKMETDKTKTIAHTIHRHQCKCMDQCLH